MAPCTVDRLQGHPSMRLAITAIENRSLCRRVAATAVCVFRDADLDMDNNYFLTWNREGTALRIPNL